MANAEDGDWIFCVKAILSASQTPFSNTNIPNLAKLILRSENEILHHGDELESFYSSFLALATHYICSGIGSLTQANVTEVCSACNIVLEFLLKRLKQRHEHCTISKKHMMVLLRSLCKGSSTSLLPKSDIITFTALLKSAKSPPHCNVTDVESEPATEAAQDGTAAPSASTAVQKQRSRSSSTLTCYDHMTAVFTVSSSAASKTYHVRSSSPSCDPTDLSTTTHIADDTSGNELSDTFSALNVSALHRLGGGDVLLDVCDTALVYLKRYRASYEEDISSATGQEMALPLNLSDALSVRMSLQSVMNDIAVVWRVFSLPVLEPMTRSRLDKIVSITMSCLHASLAAAMATGIVAAATGSTQLRSASTTKDEEIDGYASIIVQKSLEIFNWVSAAIRTSSKAGGHVLQNFHMLGAWCLLRGLHSLLHLGPAGIFDKSKDPSVTSVSSSKSKPASSDATAASAPGSKSRDPSASTSRPATLGKVHAGFGPLYVALAAHAIGLMKTIMDDLRIESLSSAATEADGVANAEAQLTLFGEYLAIQRVRRLVNCVSLPNLLIFLLGQSFRKGLSLGKPQHRPEGAVVELNSDANSNSSDSNTFYEEDFSSSEDGSNDDDDSEPILGQWFEETLSPSESQPAEMPSPSSAGGASEADGPGGKRTRRRSSTDSVSLVPDKKEPDAYIVLATDILQFISKHFLTSPLAEVRKCISESSLTEQHMLTVAALVRDLDREMTATHSGALYESFSTAMAQFVHTVISSGTLSEPLQDILLHHLGIGLTLNNADPWPLCVRPRTLAVLAEILMLRQQNERDASAPSGTIVITTKRGIEAAIMHVWTRLTTSLANAAIAADGNVSAVDLEDTNVEHLQLIVFLFHSGLSLMPKKALWLQLCQCIMRVATTVGEKRISSLLPLPLSRLLLLADYLLHFFYDMPTSLIEQVQYNLFVAFAGKKDDSPTDAKDPVISKRYLVCRDIEDGYLKHVSEAGGSASEAMNSLRPRFYNLAATDYATQDTPKVDGLAVSFLLSNPDLLDYGAFYKSVISLLAAGSSRDRVLTSSWTPLDAASIQYNMTVCWRLLGGLPPSEALFRCLEKPNYTPRLADGPLLLHFIRWIPRIPHKAFQVWIRDYVVKQGLETMKVDSLMSSVITATSSREYSLSITINGLSDIVAAIQMPGNKDVVPLSDLPSVSFLYTLDTLVAHAQILLDEQFHKTVNTDKKSFFAPPNIAVANQLLPNILALIKMCSVFVRSYVLGQVRPGDDASSSCPVTPEAFRAYGAIASIASSHNAKLALNTLMSSLPGPVKSSFEKWSASNGGTEFPAVFAWRSSFAADNLPAESYIDAVRSAHLASAASGPGNSLRHVLNVLVTFCIELATVFAAGDATTAASVADVLLPLSCEVTTNGLHDSLASALEKLVGAADSEEMTGRLFSHAISVCRDIVVQHASCLDEQVVQECLKFLETGLDHAPARAAMEKLFSQNDDLLTILLSANGAGRTPLYGTRVLMFFNKLVQLADRSPADTSAATMCGSLRKLATLDTTVMREWLSRIVIIPTGSAINDSKTAENRQLLQSLTSYIVKESSHVGAEVASAILSALIPMGSQILSSGEVTGFPDLMSVMVMLAGTWFGSGHVILFRAAVEWLELCKTALMSVSPSVAATEPTPADKKSDESASDQSSVADPSSKTQPMLETTCCLLAYVNDVLAALKNATASEGRTVDMTVQLAEDVQAMELMDSDGGDEMAPEDDDSAAEDSDDESLNSKLCTYTVTQKEFMNQHWYHCHTCKMVDGVGVCTVCARVCHRDHDLSYAKYGSFFCDCGAKEDNRCQALTKRTSESGRASSQPTVSTGSAAFDSTLAGSSRHQTPTNVADRQHKDSLTSVHGCGIVPTHKEMEKMSRVNEPLMRQVESCKDVLMSFLSDDKAANLILELLQMLMPSVVDNYQRTSILGSTARAQLALKQLRQLPKAVETTDSLMVATLGSQEGAFENVRINYSGDQGQTIRQLITSHVLRRVGMCALTSPHSRRQHLAISSEKGKVTVLQLSALLKQAHSTKRKLTLTRLSAAPIPFTVLSVAGSPCNEDYLAVCGLKDCHVLTFTTTGTVADHLVLHPSLETGNFIIKAIWLPGSQTELAIVTADFVKIYNLAVDAISPQYYFLLPTGKIRDATFIVSDNERHLLLMGSSGYIYTQAMDVSSCAQNGQFYITNILDIKHPDVKESGGHVAGGGVSIYYSHILQLLFFSYTQGKTFAAPVPRSMEELPTLFPITFKSSNGAKSGSGNQPLVQWTEVHNHPGLLCCLTQTSNTPVVLMVKPDAILVQEIKVQPAKAKIQDMVMIRHAGSATADLRTTLILLCEDGSLRIYMANIENTNFWMVPAMQSSIGLAIDGLSKSDRKKKLTQSGRPAGQVTFMVDFFEHCQQSNDVEFGGNDVLQVYNTAQVKHRLNTTGMYVASTKAGGFSLDVTNTNSNTVMVGVRILVGSQSIDRAPSYIEIFGRTNPVNLTRHRWYDLPFTRDESLTADKKFTIVFGPSIDPAGVTMVDSVKVYTKTKEAFSWPEDGDDSPDSTMTKAPTGSAAAQSTDSAADGATVPAVPAPLTSMDRLLANALEVLDSCFVMSTGMADEKNPYRQSALELSTELLTLPTPPSVQQQSKGLLSSLFLSRTAYHWHKDLAQLQSAVKCLVDYRESQEIDPESFERLVYIARSVAVCRPANLVTFAEKHFGAASSSATASLQPSTPDADNEVADAMSQSDAPKYMRLDRDEKRHFVAQLSDVFWHLHASRPANTLTAPACMPGLSRIEAIVSALIEIFYAFTTSGRDILSLLCKLYVRMLLFEDTQVSFASKQALIRVMRPKSRRRRIFIQSPNGCSSPIVGAGRPEHKESNTHRSAAGAAAAAAAVASIPSPADDEESVEQAAVADAQNDMPAPPANALEALLAGGAGNLQALLNIPDTDDETMVQLAIALSLQDQAGAGGAGLNNLNAQLQAAGVNLEAGQMSDATASGPASDDEAGSMAATVGSMLHTSERGGSGAGSDSGGSQADSVSVSGRSSAYGDLTTDNPSVGPQSDVGSIADRAGGTCGEMLDSAAPPDSDALDGDYDASRHIHALHLRMLDKLVFYMSEVKDIGGIRAIPFMQLVLSLTLELDGTSDRDKAVLDGLLSSLIASLLQLGGRDVNLADVAARSPQHEVQLVVLRLLSVLMSRTSTSSKSSSEGSSFVNIHIGRALIASGGLDYCLQLLRILLDCWKATKDTDWSVISGSLLKPRPAGSLPDMSPFFLRQYVKSHANNVFEDYQLLLMEIILRLPYQIKKIAESNPLAVHLPAFESSWFKLLTEYMMTQPQHVPYVRRQVRKLLLYICGSRDKYRQLRDMNFLETHMSSVRSNCEKRGLDMQSLTAVGPVSLTYDVLIGLIEHLKACLEIATTRTINWQKFCQKDEGVLPFLVLASVTLDDGIAPLILQLLQCALCGSKALDQSKSTAASSSSSTGIAAGTSTPTTAASAAAAGSSQSTSSPASSAATPVKPKASRDKKDEKSETKSADGKRKEEDLCRHDEALCNALVQHVCKSVGRDLLVRFIVCFLLESNLTSVRWQAHALVLHIYRSSPAGQREALLELMWTIWPDLPMYGSKASQFVDLLGYFTIKTPQTSENKMKQYVERALALLRTENKTLANHPNGSIYNILQGLVDFDGYYLEHDPCLVCNNPEIPFANIKLSSIKVDSKFTTTMQIVKLSGSHTISKITLKITDIKRAKMVRTLIVHYNNRQVQAVVELKNKPGLWHRAKKVVLSAGQTEVKVEFPLPIVACNLMIEYADFYDNVQASAETLQCPRCSASVPANPGVCGNCGENVFQCHKCRAINYDEKDPFLCNACGYCKYAKFDFALTSRPCCAVDPIENYDDRKKAVASINALLDKADHQYKVLQERKSSLEQLLVCVSDHNADRPDEMGSAPAASAPAGQTAGGGASAASATSAINKNIQLLAQRYCGDCRSAFEELSKILQKVLASRKELVEYDRQQQEAAQSATIPLSGSNPSTPTLSPRPSELFVCVTEPKLGLAKAREKRSRCFGCTSATVEHCITLLRAMAANSSLKNFLCGQGMIRELVDYNLRRGSAGLRSEVRHLLCLMSNNNGSATDELIDMLTRRVVTAVHGHLANPDFAATVRHEMLLLSNLLQLEDSLWEQRVRCVMKLFIMSMKIESPAILECISLPCLRILQHIIRPAPPTSKKNKDKPVESLCTVRPLTSDLRVDVRAWLTGAPTASFQAWKQHMPSKPAEAVANTSTPAAPASDATPAAAGGGKKKKSEEKPREKDSAKDSAKEAVRARYLMEKFGFKWRNKVVNAMSGQHAVPLKLLDKTWLRTAMFSPSSTAIRQTECSIIEAMCLVPSRKQDILDMLSSFLDEVGTSGEAASEFLSLYKRLILKDHWKYYLAVKGVPVRIAALISREIEELSRQEEISLSSDLSQGFALKSLTDLLAAFLEVQKIKHHYKSRLVGSVLNGYLSLRKLVVQRTKMIDDTQDKLLELLEEMTTGTESETKEFMAVCVDTVNKYPLNDFLSPVFIFERLCSIIFPEANDTTEFFMTLEKDPQQEDFLQGRMLGNPYSSNEPGLGPLMRDVKNKICQDCELVALLEDDTGMELLVCNKIISLDLAVSDVHRKIWAAEHGENEAMRVVYRMRGLLGDATEDMVNTLDSGKDEDVDNEEVYKMANVMSQCGGLKVLLKRLAAVRNLVTGKQLMTVLLKLFDYCLKVKANRQELIKVEMNAISIMLGALNLALLAEQESVTATKGQTLTEQILQIMETILLEASSQPHDIHKEFSKLCGDKEQLIMLLDRINSPFVRANASVLQALMRLIPFLAFGDREKMHALVNHFLPYLDFNKYDFEHTQDEQVHLDCFCVIAQGIEKNANGRKLKDLIAEHNIIRDTLHYIQMHAPASKSDSDGWKEFISKSALPYALRMLTGLCAGHPSTQVQVGQEVLPILHNLEQVSSDEHVGSLAENLLEALKENEEVAAQIAEVRQQTKAEKKRLAMAMREKQLVQLGMMTNERGQVTVKGSVLKQMEDLKEETGLTCCICREGYRYQPTKVLGIYTFTKRVNLDDGEAKPRRAQGYSTVSHFNVIHVECHLAAVRHARGREEWESAALQNGNTKCNGLLPLWGPQVPESAYASCLARHNTYLQECTGVRDATYAYTIHDLKHLFIKFGHEKSFSEDTGGGGRESNIYLVPYIMHMALYVINTTRSVGREEKNVSNFLKLPVDKWIENSFETEGALYWTVMALHINDQESWKRIRIQLLKRLIVMAHARSVSPGGATSLTDKAAKEYAVYKPYLLFFGLANCLPTILFAKCHLEQESNWSVALAEYIRNNDQLLQDNAKKVLSSFEDELLPCETIGEFCDAAGLLEDIPEPDKLVADLLQSLP